MNRDIWIKASKFCIGNWKALGAAILILAISIVALYCARSMTWEMFMDFLKAVFDLIKGIAWPLGILTAALIFKSDVKNLIPRIRKIGTSGFELDGLEQQQVPAPLPPAQTANLEPPTVAIAEIENRIRSDLANETPEVKEQILVRRLAFTSAAAYFENTYGLIFGTQIQGLEKLFEIGSISLTEAKEYYYSVLQPLMDAPHAISFEDWSGFLISRELIKMDEGKVTITEMGKEFVRFLKSQNKPAQRPL